MNAPFARKAACLVAAAEGAGEDVDVAAHLHEAAQHQVILPLLAITLAAAVVPRCPCRIMAPMLPCLRLHRLRRHRWHLHKLTRSIHSSLCSRIMFNLLSLRVWCISKRLHFDPVSFALE